MPFDFPLGICGVLLSYQWLTPLIILTRAAGPEHPSPGQLYSGFSTVAYLPNNKDGKEICILLRRAFDARLMFTIGTSPATGEENAIVWNGIELKTCQSGGPAKYVLPLYSLAHLNSFNLTLSSDHKA